MTFFSKNQGMNQTKNAIGKNFALLFSNNLHNVEET